MEAQEINKNIIDEGMWANLRHFLPGGGHQDYQHCKPPLLGRSHCTVARQQTGTTLAVGTMALHINI